MLQEAMDELLDGQRAEFGLAGVGGPIAKGDLLVLDLHQAAIAQGHAKHIRGQILEGRLAIADRLTMHHPIGRPDLRGDALEHLGRAQGLAEAGAKDTRQRFDGHQKVVAGGLPGAGLGHPAAGRDQVVDMRMISQRPAPGVQDPDQAQLSADEARIVGQVLGGRGRGAKEAIIDQRLMLACDRPQRRRAR